MGNKVLSPPLPSSSLLSRGQLREDMTYNNNNQQTPPPPTSIFGKNVAGNFATFIVQANDPPTHSVTTIFNGVTARR